MLKKGTISTKSVTNYVISFDLSLHDNEKYDRFWTELVEFA